MNMRVLTPAQMPDWDRLIATFPGHSVFHTSLWAKVLEKTYGFVVRYVLWDQGTSLVAFPIALVKSGLLGRRAVCFSFSDSCPPLSSDGSFPCDLLRMLEHWGHSKRLRSIEFRGGDLGVLDLRVSREYVEHVVDLQPGVMSLWAGLRPSTQRNIRKANRVGLYVTVSQEQHAIDSYYRIHCATRQKLGIPPQPRKFFRNVHEFLISGGNGLVVIAWRSGMPIAGGVFLHFGKQAIYKFGASRVEFQEHRPNNLVMWTAIKWYAEGRFDSISLGRTDPMDSGLLQFKDGWGAVRRPLSYWRLGLGSIRKVPPKQKASGGASFARAIARRLPVPLLRAIGAAVYPFLG